MKSLKELCENIIKKKCTEPINLNYNWLTCGFRYIPLKFYQDLLTKLDWYCECKRRKFTITNYTYYKTFTKFSDPENCFYGWFTFLIKIKIKTIIKNKNNLIHLASNLQKFFKLINEFKYIYLRPNTYQNIENMNKDDYETFAFNFDTNFYCFCFKGDLLKYIL